jgi:hypothetical protein
MTESLTPTEEQKTKETLLTPAEFLATVPGAPTPQQLDGWKANVPNHRLKLFAPEKGRVFIIRGITGLEMTAIRRAVPDNARDPDDEVQCAAVEKAVLWTNTTASNRITRAELVSGSAGLPFAIFTVIAELSDYYAPDFIASVSGDL